MNWKIRHEGSPRSIEGLTAEQVVEGLQDALWEPTDEVMGPGDTTWVAIENHSQFADVAADLEPPPAREHDDETRLDMNPLIDVCLVLLIFFILTTSYVALQKYLEMPGVSPQDQKGPPVFTKEAVEKFTIRVEARQVDGKPVIRVEDQETPQDQLVPTLKRWVKKTTKTELLLDARGVDWGTVVAIQDAAKGAGVQRVHFQVNADEVP
jgi:biopolymer transport protein ExbD